MQSHEQKGQKITNWQVLILFLSVFAILSLMAETFFPLDQDISQILTTVDNFVCIVFLCDFFWRVTKADRMNYLKWGWVDLISSIPNLELLRWGRFVRIFKILRILRGVRSLKIIFKHLYANRAKGTFYSVTMISFLLVVLGSIAILHFETSPDSNIAGPSDAMWWAFVTITTVGYGDYFPVTLEGRVIAGLLMTAGVGLFGTFTAYVASLFIEEEAMEDETRDIAILQAIAKLDERMKTIEEEIKNKP